MNPTSDRFSQPLYGETSDPRTDEELEEIEMEKADQQYQNQVEE